MDKSFMALREGADVDGLVQELRRLHQATGLHLMIRVGALIVDRIYGGDPARWRSHGRKDTSFRKLAAHPDSPFEASTLSRAVGIYLLTRRRPDIARLAHVGPSHLQEILGLDEGTQDRLLERAESDAWSTRRLRDEVRAAPGNARGRRRLPRVPAFQGYAEEFRGRVEARALLTDWDAVDALDGESARTMLVLVRTLCQQGEMLAGRLSARLAALESSSNADGWADEAPSGVVRSGVAAPQRSSDASFARAGERTW